MFDYKSKFMKIVGYIIIAFFALIIIISFGMPDFMSRMGLDKTIVAKVNGESVHYLDFIRYRDSNPRFAQFKNKNMNDLILNSYIGEILMLQTAKQNGFRLSDEKLIRTIRKIPSFKDPKTGNFDYDRYNLILRQNNLNDNSFQRSMKKSLTNELFTSMLRMGTAVPSDEIKKEYLIQNSRIRLKVAHISDFDLKKLFKSKLTATKAEIDNEIKNLKEMKDPKSDRKKAERNIIEKKFSTLKKSIKDDINQIASSKGSFDKSAAIIKGKIFLTDIFKPGDNVKAAGAKGVSLSSMTNSKIFTNHCLSLENGVSSPLIDTAAGLYIFTPVLKQLPATDRITDEFKTKTIQGLERRIAYSVYQNMREKITSEAKIIKNLKTD